MTHRTSRELGCTTDLTLQLLVLDVTDVLEVTAWRSCRDCDLGAGLAWNATEVCKESVDIVANGDTIFEKHTDKVREGVLRIRVPLLHHRGSRRDCNLRASLAWDATEVCK